MAIRATHANALADGDDSLSDGNDTDKEGFSGL